METLRAATAADKFDLIQTYDCQTEETVLIQTQGLQFRCL